MNTLGDIVTKVRSKNAGPFWLTVDIFCGTADVFMRVSNGLSSQAVADLFRTNANELKRFDMADLNVVKFSLPRPAIQGTTADRDMHGAAAAVLVAGLPLKD